LPKQLKRKAIGKQTEYQQNRPLSVSLNLSILQIGNLYPNGINKSQVLWFGINSKV